MKHVMDIHVCPECGGAGEFDVLMQSYSHTQISPDYRRERCEMCAGTGRVTDDDFRQWNEDNSQFGAGA